MSRFQSYYGEEIVEAVRLYEASERGNSEKRAEGQRHILSEATPAKEAGAQIV